MVPVDTTSCGVYYCACFIAGLDRGWSPIEAARLATTAAALVESDLGTLGKVADLAGVERSTATPPLRTPMSQMPQDEQRLHTEMTEVMRALVAPPA